MSKLADLIRRATRAEPAPIGFAPASAKLPPTMVLVALVGERWAQSVADAADVGADAFLLTGRPSERELSEAVSAAGGRPCGLLAAETDGEQLSRLRSGGIDFVMIELQAPASALLQEELGFILHLRDELTDIQLRTLEALPLNALFVERDAAPLTISRQLELQRISGLARKPLLLKVAPNIGQPDLLAQRDAGVALAAVDMKDRGATDALRGLRATIDALPRRRRPRQEDRPTVTLPGAASPAEEEEEDEE